jgi:hypothetical protein
MDAMDGSIPIQDHETSVRECHLSAASWAVVQNGSVVRTELRRGRDDAFVVRTEEEDFQAVLPELAYPREAEDEFVRRFPTSEPTPTIYGRFSASIERLLAQTCGRERPPWEESLQRLHHRLAAAGVEWMLGGSVALAIRGVSIVPRDIDFTVADQRATARAFSGLLIEPPLRSHGRWIAEWFGRAWDGIRIEWAAETRPDLDDHDWTSDIGPNAVARAETIEWQGLSFRVPPLDLQVAVTRERGLEERLAAIEALSD